MVILEKVLLASYTTFKIGGEAKYFCEVKDQFDALTAFEFAKKHSLPVFILGGGSNVLISDKGFNGLVIRVVNSGIEILAGEDDRHSPEENDGHLRMTDKILLKVASGENWDSVVSFAVKNNWWGIENLSHIPGSTGAIAVQNVGAYGQEAKNVIESVIVFDKETHQITAIKNADCGFAYRSSIFNTARKGRYIIFEIIFKLSKIPNPVLNYKDVAKRFGTALQNNPSLEEIRKAIIEIRDIKFPFPTQALNGNAGSFFKNIALDKAGFDKLKNQVKDVFGKIQEENLSAKTFQEKNNFKVPAAFLLELCGFKDASVGGASINHNQPLVILNKTGNATSADVLSLAAKVIGVVKERCGVVLQIEPELIGFSEKELEILKV